MRSVGVFFALIVQFCSFNQLAEGQQEQYVAGDWWQQQQDEAFDIRQHYNYKLLPPKDKCGLATEQRIIGGYLTELGQIPWIARIAFAKNKALRRRMNSNRKISDNLVTFSCGGSLISKYYVVTAAHCTLGPADILFVRLGEWDVDTDPDCQNGVCAPLVQDITVVDVISHKFYSNDEHMKNDIALLRLEKPPILNRYVQPICLPYGPALTRDFTGEDTIVAGWGLTETDAPSTMLLAVQQTVYDNDRCLQVYADNNINVRYRDGQMCVGGIIGKDSCNGDSGGPLLWTGSFDRELSARTYLIGLVSLGPASCGVHEIPGVYTRTAFFMKWILDNMRE
ncbi:hypothetical protein WDU94_012924 [Cyamophila willieti]